MSEFYDWLESERKRLGWKQVEMMEYLGGIPLGTYQAWRKGESKPTAWAESLIRWRLSGAKPKQNKVAE